MRTTKFIRFAIWGFVCLSLSSCGTWYYSTLNSRGATPIDKSYYLSSSDSTIVKTLEFKEYASFLKERLNELGYVEKDNKSAALCIFLDYGMGDTYLAGSTASSYTYTNTNLNTNLKSSSSANTLAKTNINTNNNNYSANTSAFGTSNTNTNVQQRTNAMSSTSTGITNTYKIPLYVEIRAFDNITGDPIWEVNVKDDLDRETQIQSVMPWLLLSTQEYIGKSSTGEKIVKINNTPEIKDKYKLVWPY